MLQGVDDLRDDDGGGQDCCGSGHDGDAGEFPPGEVIHGWLLRLRLADWQRHPARLLLADRGGDWKRLTHRYHRLPGRIGARVE